MVLALTSLPKLNLNTYLHGHFMDKKPDKKQQITAQAVGVRDLYAIKNAGK